MDMFTAKQYLQIDIASNFGLDKEDWDIRLAWFDKYEKHLETKINEADEPALYFAGVQAYRDMQAQKPTGYMISLDATSSGLQLLAALTGDRRASEICNVVDVGHRKDAYTEVYASMLNKVGEAGKISRDMSKDAVMTALYGSTAMPKQVFGEGALLNTFYKTMIELAPAAWELNEAFLAIWDSSKYVNSWVLPDNFHVHVKVMNQVKERVHFLNEPFDVFYNVNMPVEEGRSLGANTIHSIDGMIVREMTRRCDYDPIKINKIKEFLSKTLIEGANDETADDKMVQLLWKHYKSTGYLSARILEHLDNSNIGHTDPVVIRNLIDSLPAKPFKVISIHDCFRCHPNYGNDLRRQYALQLSLIGRSDLLTNVLSQIIGKNIPKINKLHPTLWKEMLDSNYALS